MVQSSAQFTPVQVLQAARRAEAEGKMDYALQFYRHLVEHHGTTSESQEAREGLFRIAEWRWGEGRNANRQQSPSGQNGHQTHTASQAGPAAYAPGAAYAPPARSEQGRMPDIITREVSGHADDVGISVIKERYRAANFIALLITVLGWVCVFAGVLVGALAASGLVAEISVAGALGLPLGIVFGLPAALSGLVLIVAGQLAVAVFENANATLELVAIERAKAGL